MNISQEEAQASLKSVRNVTTQTHKALASYYANPLLIMWGLLWIMAFAATQFYYTYAFYIFTVMSIIGAAGTAVIMWMFYRKAPVKETSSYTLSRRILALWIFSIIYIGIWLFLFAPFTGLQCNALICTAAMFIYIVMGLWLESRFMITLGLIVTAATLIGYYLLQNYYCLWMAVVGGGAIFSTGFYIRLRWR